MKPANKMIFSFKSNKIMVSEKERFIKPKKNKVIKNNYKLVKKNLLCKICLIINKNSMKKFEKKFFFY